MNTCDFYLIVIGTCTLVYFAAKVVKVFVQLWRESLWSETFDFKKLGNWAVITGGSDGIGKSVALELAKCGLNIVVIARTRSKLEKFAKEIFENHSVEVRIIPIDVTSDDYIFDVIKEKTEGLDIAVLVNNVAVARSEPTEFLKVPNYEKYSINCVRANVNTMVKLTELFLPDMVKKRSGMIVNMSSLLGSTDSPYFAMYGATKKLIITYTNAISEEYKKYGIIFQCIIPAATETPLTSGVVKSNFMVPTGEEYGKYVVKAMGKSLYTNTGFWGHILSQQIVWLTPTFVFAKVMKKGAEDVEREKQSH